MNCFPSFSTQKKSQRVKARNISTSSAAEEKERYTKYMTVDYMSSEQSMSESEGTNSENGYENPDVEKRLGTQENEARKHTLLIKIVFNLL